MSETLIAALQLTVVGIGMTFLSIGALTLGMYVMTKLTQAKPEDAALPDTLVAEAGDEATLAVTSGTWQDETKSVSGEAARRRQAAAAAVALALAQAALARSPRFDAPQQSGDASGVVDTWTSYVREQHLSRRIRHDLRSSHRRQEA